MTAAEADRIHSLRARGLNAAAIAERLGWDAQQRFPTEGHRKPSERFSYRR